MTTTNLEELASRLSEVPVCGRRDVIVGQWGHMLAHPSDCPDCYPRRSKTVYSIAEALREHLTKDRT